MDNVFYTLYDFFLHTESVTYLLIIPALLGITLFWRILAGKDEEWLFKTFVSDHKIKYLFWMFN